MYEHPLRKEFEHWWEGQMRREEYGCEMTGKEFFPPDDITKERTWLAYMTAYYAAQGDEEE